MEMNEAIQYALEGKAILFAGSGFSYGAENNDKESFKTGLELRDYLADKCNALGTQNHLSTVADYYVSLPEHSVDDLITLLQKQLSLGKIASHHKSILSIRWKRIYTTNYDHVIEEASAQNGNELSTITMCDNLDNYPKNKVCVHINGSIQRLNRDTLNKEFKLTDSSYDTEELRGKPWFDFMERDFVSAKAIIIIGFSMQSDIDIRRIIASPGIAKKVIFISKRGLDPIDKNVLAKYADVMEIGVDGFAVEIEKAKTKFVPSIIDKAEYISFLHEHMTPLLPKKLEYTDYINFYFKGESTDAFFNKDMTGKYLNIVNRSAVDAFLLNMYKYRVFIAVSGLGDGKTVFCDLVRNELREKDIDVFTYMCDSVDIDDEISSICNDFGKKKRIVIIDDYYKYINILRRFREFGIDNCIFLLTSRQSKSATNFRKLVNALDISEEEIYPLYLYTIKDVEVENLAEIFINNSLLPEKIGSREIKDVTNYLNNTCKSHFSSIVLDLFESSYIKEELTKLYRQASKDDTEAVKELSVIALASAVMNFDLTLSDMTSFLNIDYVTLRLGDSMVINEIFDVTNNELKIKSSIISRKILYSIISPKLLMKVLKKIVFSADKTYVTNSRHEELLKAILSHSNFLNFTTEGSGVAIVKEFYNDIRNTTFCRNGRNSPFFWEQFGLTCIDAKDFKTAKQCLETALLVAKDIPNFVPFQIETVYADYLIEDLKSRITVKASPRGEILPVIIDAHFRLLKHYDHKENNHFYVFKVGAKIADVFFETKDSFDSRELSIFIEKMIILSKRFLEYKRSGESAFNPAVNNFGEKIDRCIFEAKQQLKQISTLN